MMPDYMESLVSNIGVKRILTDLLDVIDECLTDDPKDNYLWVLKMDLEIALRRYNSRYMLEGESD